MTPTAIAAAKYIHDRYLTCDLSMTPGDLAAGIDAAGVAALTAERDETAMYLRREWLSRLRLCTAEIAADIHDQPLNLKDEAEQLAACVTLAERDCARLTAERDALREACQSLVADLAEWRYHEHDCVDAARKLLAELEGTDRD